MGPNGLRGSKLVHLYQTDGIHLPSPSQALLRNLNSLWAWVKLSSDIPFPFEPQPSVDRILSLFLSQAKLAQLKPAQYPLIKCSVQCLVYSVMWDCPQSINPARRLQPWGMLHEIEKHCTLHVARSTVNTTRWKQHTAYCTLHSASWKMHTLYCALHTAHVALHTKRFT